MSYSTLGCDCIPQTNALTSNKKYLNPLNPVYFKFYTQMNKYPGENCGVEPNNVVTSDHPEHIKEIIHDDKNGSCQSC